MLGWLLIAMSAAGAIGGLSNYLLTEAPAPEGQRLRKWWQFIVLGMCASYTVPLFLNTISSAIVSDVISSDGGAQAVSKLLVITGFCILAAVSSRAFMQSLTNRALRIAQKANEAAQNANETANDAKAVAVDAKKDAAVAVEHDDDAHDDLPSTKPEEIVAAANIILKGNEVHAVGEVGPPDDLSVESDELHLLTGPEATTLHAIANSGYVYRTVRGIAKTVGVTPSSAAIVLMSLESRGLVTQRWQEGQAPKYRITPKGIRALWSHEQDKSK